MNSKTEYSTAELRINLGEALARPHFRNEIIFVSKYSLPYAAIISINDARLLETLKGQETRNESDYSIADLRKNLGEVTGRAFGGELLFISNHGSQYAAFASAEDARFLKTAREEGITDIEELRQRFNSPRHPKKEAGEPKKTLTVSTPDENSIDSEVNEPTYLSLYPEYQQTDFTSGVERGRGKGKTPQKF